MRLVGFLGDCVDLRADEVVLFPSFLHLFPDLGSEKPGPFLLHGPHISQVPLLLQLELDLVAFLLLLVVVVHQLLRAELGLLQTAHPQPQILS